MSVDEVCCYRLVVQVEHGRLPAPASEADASALLAAARNLGMASASGSLDEHTLRLLAYSATGDLNPMAAMFGGMVGQEVIQLYGSTLGSTTHAAG
jgi:hypothetical protein